MVFHDISERRRAELNAARLAAIVETSNDAIIGKDLSGRITSWNRGAERIYGYTPDEIVGRHVSTLAPPELADELNGILRRLRAGEQIEHHETTRVRKDGARIEVSLTISPIMDAAGHIIGASTIARDITERKRAEQLLRESERQLQLVTDSAPVFISYCDTQQRFRFVNRPYAEHFGLTPDQIVGRAIPDVLGDEAYEAIRPHVEAALAGRRAEFEAEVPYRDIGRHYVRVQYVPHEEENGRVVGFVAIISDITERRQAEREREHLLHLEQAARAAAEQAAARTARLQSVTAALSEALTPAEVASVIVEHGLSSLGATGGAVVVHNEDVAGELELIGSMGLPDAAVEKWRSFPLSTRVPTAEAVRTGRRVLVPSIDEWLGRNPPTGLLGELDGVGAMAAVPLVVEGRAIGAIGLSFPAPRLFDEEDTAFLDALARQCAQALDRARLYEVERRARLEIESSEHRYRALADSMPQIVWTARADGFIDYYNRRWYEYTGTAPGQTEGWGWQHVLHPDDAEHCLRRWSRSIVSGEEYEIEHRFRCAADGEYRWHLGRAEPLRNAMGRVVKWFGTATDIHDQKQAADRLRSLAEASALLASSLDYETTLEGLARLIVSVLADYCLIDLIGPDGEVTRVAATHADPARGELVRRLRDFPLDMTKETGVSHVLRTGRAHITPDVSEAVLRSLAHGEGHYRLLRELGLRSFMTVPLVARERTIGALTLGSSATRRRYGPDDLAFAEEIARRAALAIDNARLYREVRDANRAKDEFLATLSHELRTPLTPIIGWTHMMKAGRLPPADAAHGLNVVEKNAQALTRLINDLLDMSSILSGKMSIERAPVDLEQTVAEAVETVRPQAASRGVALEFAPRPGAARWVVSGDRTRLVQVFWNLLNNAVKFSGKGGRVTVNCAGSDGHARVEIVDDGAGIAADFLPHVFERFRQADGTPTREHGGLGIGLALVKSFTEAHGGVVTAESGGPGSGSRFVVSLPLLRTAETGVRIDEEAADEQSALRPPPSAVPSKGRVLVVEDARDTLDMLRVAFAAHGYEPVVCVSAAEALRAAADVCFDIIVSDIGLPQLDGYDLIGLLREIEHLREVPAVALTGYASARDAEAALEAGFDLHLPKPVDPTALISSVERLLAERRRRADPGVDVE
jgi:PAS domain S-box-containing protein